MNGIGEPMTLDVSEWVNGPPVDLADLRGRVVLIETFQMLCPGCVSAGLPQAQRVHRTFPRSEVVVLGLHTVFEHHDVMGPDALAVFLSEYRIDFPVAVDRSTGTTIPATMARYQLQGTPSTLLIDRAGRLRHSSFGVMDDLALGTRLGQLIAETQPDTDGSAENGATGPRAGSATPAESPAAADGCDPAVGCATEPAG